MSFKIKASEQFEKKLKKLAKKYSSLKSEYPVLLAELRENPFLGTPIGNNCYKIRISIASKGKGKRGGARVITYLQVNDELLVLLSIYNKGDKDNISNKEIIELLKEFAEE